jgi:hypothetical protein
MNTALGGGTFTGNHAIAHDSEGKGSGIAAGDRRRFEGIDRFGEVSDTGSHRYVLLLSFSFFRASICLRA